MSDPVDEAVRKLAKKVLAGIFDDQTADSSQKVAERILTEQLAPLLRAGQEMSVSFYGADKWRSDDWDAAFAKLTGRTS